MSPSGGPHINGINAVRGCCTVASGIISYEYIHSRRGERGLESQPSDRHERHEPSWIGERKNACYDISGFELPLLGGSIVNRTK